MLVEGCWGRVASLGLLGGRVAGEDREGSIAIQTRSKNEQIELI